MIPKVGQYFTIENLTSDRSYHNTIFKCISLNDSHVLAQSIKGTLLNNPILLSPKIYEFFDANSFAEALDL